MTAGGYMGATVDWTPFIYLIGGMIVAGCILFGLGCAMRPWFARLAWKRKCRRYWREHPYYDANQLQPRSRRRG
jgi:hypothetical protein